MSSTTTQTAQAELNGFQGQLIGPSDTAYEQARRVYNAMIDKRPALIARCAGPDDVARAIRFAAEHSLLVAVRGGAHNGAGFGTCDDGVKVFAGPELVAHFLTSKNPRASVVDVFVRADLQTTGRGAETYDQLVLGARYLLDVL